MDSDGFNLDDPYARQFMALLAAARISLYRQRVAGEARAVRGKGLTARAIPPQTTVSPVSTLAGATHPALINHGNA